MQWVNEAHHKLSPLVLVRETPWYYKRDNQSCLQRSKHDRQDVKCTGLRKDGTKIEPAMHSVNSATKYSRIIKWFITLQRQFNVFYNL